ncbi:MAG: PfkB family carbohydrate kinase [Clostridiales bacterium]|nr:PfkB family carbohydrate kinase [Clostridiales bacterium]
MGGVKIGLLGDVCLDVYWRADMRKSELSRETPHFPLPVVEERMSPGGGANVAANMAALGPKSVRVFSAVGDDWRGRELLRLLDRLGIGLSGIVVAGAGRVTNAYVKPIRMGFSGVAYEDPRLDFASLEPLPREAEDRLVAALDEAAGDLDVLCVSDQMPSGVVTERVRARLSALAGQGLRVVADSRERVGLFSGMTVKPNEIEGAKAAGLDPDAARSVEGSARAALALSEKIGGGVFMTLGARGSLYADGGGSWHIPAHEVEGPIDFCGAGDSSLSAFGLALAAGADPREAACVAGLCSEVTIRQIGATGTASRAQLLAWRARIGERAA